MSFWAFPRAAKGVGKLHISAVIIYAICNMHPGAKQTKTSGDAGGTHSLTCENYCVELYASHLLLTFYVSLPVAYLCLSFPFIFLHLLFVCLVRWLVV